MKRGLTALGAFLIVTCAKVEPEPVPAPVPASSARTDGAESPARCTELKWTPDLVRTLGFEAFEDENVGGEDYAAVRGALPLFPATWPTPSCAVVVYFYYADEPRIVPHDQFDGRPNGWSSPLLAAARVDLKSSSVELKVLDYSESPLKNRVHFGKRWKVAETYMTVADAEENLIEAVVTQAPVSDPRMFEAYSRAWQQYPQYVHLVPSVHRDFIGEMLRVRPLELPEPPPSGWVRSAELEANDFAP
jgi:hypothetical protein